MGLTLAAIALGVASLVLGGGFVDDILLQLREATIHSHLGHLQVYKIGQFAIERQRAAASEREGAGFSLRAFHDRLLALGSLPLTALRRELAP